MAAHDTQWTSPTARCKIERSRNGGPAKFTAEVIPVPVKVTAQLDVLAQRNRFLSICAALLAVVLAALALGVYQQRIELNHVGDEDLSQFSLSNETATRLRHSFEQTMAESFHDIIKNINTTASNSRTALNKQINESLTTAEADLAHAIGQNIVRVQETVDARVTQADASILATIEQHSNSTRNTIDKMVASWTGEICSKITGLIKAGLPERSGTLRGQVTFDVARLLEQYETTKRRVYTGLKRGPVGHLDVITRSYVDTDQHGKLIVGIQIGCVDEPGMRYPLGASINISLLGRDKSTLFTRSIRLNQIGSCVDPVARSEDYGGTFYLLEYLKDKEALVDGSVSYLLSI